MCKLGILYSLGPPLRPMWDVPHLVNNRKTTDCEMDQAIGAWTPLALFYGNYGTEGAEEDKILSAYGEERYMITQLNAK